MWQIIQVSKLENLGINIAPHLRGVCLVGNKLAQSVTACIS